jgi:NADPH-dependent 2,4-dienoyl-CoA reductase/sulfur reductase-like enzyme
LKAEEGRLDEIRRCIACNQGCMEKVVMENSLSCLHNPEVGYETVFGLGQKAKKSKKVLVVGGGLAGMEAACVVATKGHHVRLIEKEEELGGSSRVASVLNEKKEFGGVLEFLEHRVKKLKIDIRLKEDFNVPRIKKENFDEIIIATGSTPVTPKVSLHPKYKVRFAKEALKNTEGLGQNIFVLGGGSVGIEVAEYLHRHLGKNVTVIEMLDKIGGDLGPLNRVNVLERIDRSSIKIMSKTKVLELNDEGIKVLKEGIEELLPPPDSVVLAMGAVPHPLSLHGVKGRIHYVGDCKKVGNAMDAIHGAFNMAVRI